MNDFNVIIPARMQSTRLPHKMTLPINNIPLIIHTAQRATKSNAKQVIVATDHEEILSICKSYDIKAVMTDQNHKSGTDRIAEVAKSIGLYEHEIIVNVQGDEPLIDPKLINQLAEFTYKKNAQFATAARVITDTKELFNSNIVKVVLNKESNALYFSRSPIPFYRDGSWQNVSDAKIPDCLNLLGHIGMYAYTVDFLGHYSKLEPSPVEQVEALEQLRILYNGYNIAVMVTNLPHNGGVDTLEDLQRVRRFVANKKPTL